MHTPGPWEVEINTDDYVRQWADIRPDITTVAIPQDKDDAARRIADARLIAAAPDLLEACEAALDDLEWAESLYHCVENGLIDRLKAAIKKAREG